MAEPADVNVDELRRRARRRLVGAVVLALGVAVVVPMLLETEQKPLGDDVSVKIPPVDSGKFVNRLNDGTGTSDANAKAADDAAKPAPAASSAAEAAPERPKKYDTRLPDAAPASSATPPSSAAAGAPEPAATASTSSPASTAPVIITDKSTAAPSEATSQKPAAAENPRTGAAASHRVPEPARSAHGESGTSPHDGYAVQLAAFADDRGANSLAGRLKKSGYAAYTEPLKTSKGTLWRVRVGPYPSRDAAIAARDKLKTEGQSGIVAAIK
ncbi:MAG TPA: SPOR domain-containing protein [Casimicrobiaceae bacterium]|nr:SPOR domain-containing protein [Casimicrobiaceae bacterium]